MAKLGLSIPGGALSLEMGCEGAPHGLERHVGNLSFLRDRLQYSLEVVVHSHAGMVTQAAMNGVPELAS